MKKKKLQQLDNAQEGSGGMIADGVIERMDGRKVVESG